MTKLCHFFEKCVIFVDCVIFYRKMCHLRRLCHHFDQMLSLLHATSNCVILTQNVSISQPRSASISVPQFEDLPVAISLSNLNKKKFFQLKVRSDIKT